MGRLMTAQDYRREIAEIEAMLETDRQISQAHGTDPAAEMSRRSLERRLAALRSELTERGDTRLPGHELDVVFEGTPVEGHTIDSEFLSIVLRDIQLIVRGVVEAQSRAITRGKESFRQLRRRSALRLANTYPGSFGLHLETTDDQFDLLGEDISPVFRAISAVVNLVDEQPDDQELLSSLTELGEKPTKMYTGLLRHLDQFNASIRVSWPTIAGTRTGRLSPVVAAKRRQRLERVHLKTRIRYADGRLDEAGIRRGYFEFITDGDELIKGRVADEAVPCELDAAPPVAEPVAATVPAAV